VTGWAVGVGRVRSEEQPMATPRDRRIDYIEFGTKDLPATRTFYQTVFGWKFTDYGPDYTSFEDGRIAGGFRTDETPGKSPLVVIYADDLEAIKARVAGAGIKVFNEHSFPGGRRFHFVDPGGNEVAVWSEH
jgi:predicted enzyme related to lactoylglutathione lyase